MEQELVDMIRSSSDPRVAAKIAAEIILKALSEMR